MKEPSHATGTCDSQCESCAVRSSCTDPRSRDAGVGEGQEEIIARMGRIRHKILIGSGKGGVGKSTMAVRLTLALRDRGYRVGLFDADITGPNVPSLLGVEGQGIRQAKNGIVPVDAGGIKVVSMAFILSSADTAVVWRGPMKMAAIKQFLSGVDWGDLDYLIVDLPPGTSDEPLSIIQLVSGITGALIVSTPQDVAILDSRKAINMFRSLEVPILGVVENMSGLRCPDCGMVVDVFGKGGGERAAEELGVPFLGAVPIYPDLVVAGDDDRLPAPGAPEDAFEGIVARLVERIASEEGYLAGD